MRADARRNHERLLGAARDAFAERGLDVGVAEIARRAGVGPGTLFRHFPTKDDLIVAVVEAQLGELLAEGEAGLRDEDPWRGLVRFLEAAAERQTDDRGLFEAVGSRLHRLEGLQALRDRFHALCGALLRRAQDAGAVRADLVAEDMPFLLHLAASTSDLARLPGLHRRYLALLLDGLRPGAASPLAPAPPTIDELALAIGRDGGRLRPRAPDRP